MRYGDPPVHGCVGDTMNAIPVRVLEFWVHDGLDKRRVTEFEVALDDDGSEEGQADGN